MLSFRPSIMNVKLDYKSYPSISHMYNSIQFNSWLMFKLFMKKIDT